MRLSDAAKFFDKTLCADAYTPFTTFYGQLDVYDDSKRDGVTIQRRVLSLAPGVSIPARRVATINNEKWIIGAHEADMFKGNVIRDKYVMHRADGICTLQTAGQALSSGGTSAYAAKVWVKDLKEVEVSSKLSGFYNIYLPSSEVVLASDIVTVAGRRHIVRNVLLSAAGFKVAEVDELASDSLQAATYKPRTYSPTSDSFATGTPVSVNALRMRFQDDYQYATASAPKMVEGDIRVLVPTSITPKAKDLLTLPDYDWQIISVVNEVTAWGLHLRRAT